MRDVESAHLVHVILSVLVMMEAQDLYDKLRTTYNDIRLPGIAAVPTLQRWRGVKAICPQKSAYCRYREGRDGMLSRDATLWSHRCIAWCSEISDIAKQWLVYTHSCLVGNDRTLTVVVRVWTTPMHPRDVTPSTLSSPSILWSHLM